MPAWGFDLIVVGLTLLSAVMSIGRGLIREAFSVISFGVGFVAAAFCVQLFRAPLASVMTPQDPQSIYPAAILVVVGFFVAYALAAFLGSRVSKLIHSSPEIGALDRIAGAGFGIVRGILAAVLFVLLVHQVMRPGEEPDWLAKSQSYPYLDTAANAVGGVLTTVIEFFIGKAAPPPTP